jgi:hypothetical protein
MTIVATPDEIREQRRSSPTAPLGYLYQIRVDNEPDVDITVTAGHYDETNLVWVYSGQLGGIVGLTESYPSND